MGASATGTTTGTVDKCTTWSYSETVAGWIAPVTVAPDEQGPLTNADEGRGTLNVPLTTAPSRHWIMLFVFNRSPPLQHRRSHIALPTLPRTIDRNHTVLPPHERSLLG